MESDIRNELSSHLEIDRQRIVSNSTFMIKDLCSAYIIIWALTPIISESIVFRSLAVISSIVFLFKTVPVDLDKQIRNYWYASIFMLVLYLLINFIGQFSFPIAKVINLFVFVILGLISLHYYIYENEKFTVYVKLIILLYIIVCIPSLIAVHSNMYVLRRASGITIRHGIERFAGSYGFVYGCVFLITFLVYDLHEYKKTRLSLIWQISVISLLAYLIINSGYTTALVLTVIGIVSALAIRKNPLITVIVASISVAGLIYFVPIILQYITNNFDIPIVYQQKLTILTQMTDSSNSMSYSETTRGGLLKMGLDSIINYPVLGSVIITGSTSSGGHQQIVDVLADYGVAYALLFYYVVVGTPYRMASEDKGVRLVYLILALSLGLSDTFDFATMSIPLFLCPYISQKRLLLKSINRE